ncbi:hypothetical protein MVEG_07425 [Podila verticillata NRRL 6337]|nr:hypothetical protein MVEG_07425 [Podila verticillata NRRL 6337]
MHLFDKIQWREHRKKPSFGETLSRTFSLPAIKTSRTTHCGLSASSISSATATSIASSRHDSASHCSDDARTMVNFDTHSPQKGHKKIRREISLDDHLPSCLPARPSSRNKHRSSSIDLVAHLSPSPPPSPPRHRFKSTLSWLLKLHKRNTPSNATTATAELANVLDSTGSGTPIFPATVTESFQSCSSPLPIHPFCQSQNLFSDHPPSPQHPCTVTPAIPIPISANPARFPGKSPTDLASKHQQLFQLQQSSKRSPPTALASFSTTPTMSGARHLIPHHHNTPPPSDGCALLSPSSPKLREKHLLSSHPSPPSTPPSWQNTPIRPNSHYVPGSSPSQPPSDQPSSVTTRSIEEMEILALGVSQSIRRSLQGQKHHVDSLSLSIHSTSSSSYSGPRKSSLGDGYDIVTMWALGPPTTTASVSTPTSTSTPLPR